MKYKIVASTLALTLAAGLGIIGTAHTAYASQGSGHQFLNSGIYINAWGGGPDIKAYTAPALYNDFTIVPNPDGPSDINIQLTGGTSPYDNDCIGDLGNSPTNTQAGLVGGCGTTGIGWGGNFTIGPCDGNKGLWFKSVRWAGGYLAETGTSKGSVFYLDLSQTCFDIQFAF